MRAALIMIKATEPPSANDVQSGGGERKGFGDPAG
jgi:hypothetical protein